ncbi:MAG: MarR family transcriptional regulator [Pirellulales bacterium]|nr:MarR family transcriptional regulator [Pirellulales bacterium]
MHAPDTTELIDVACRLIVTGRSMARQLAAAVRAYGLSESEFRLLWIAQRCPACDQKQLANQLGLSPAQVSGLVERLRAGGSIFPSVAVDDRRRQLWQLTPSGGAMVSRIVAELASTSVAVEGRDWGLLPPDLPGEAA